MKEFEKSKVPRLFELLKEKNITAAELARELHISKGNITDWKMGRATPSKIALVAIADYLGTTTEYLQGENGLKFTTNTVTGNYNVVGNHNSDVRMNTSPDGLTDQETELVRIYRTLSEINKAKALLYIAELK